MPALNFESLNANWREDILASCVDRLCYGADWGYFHLFSCAVTVSYDYTGYDRVINSGETGRTYTFAAGHKCDEADIDEWFEENGTDAKTIVWSGKDRSAMNGKTAEWADVSPSEYVVEGEIKDAGFGTILGEDLESLPGRNEGNEKGTYRFRKSFSDPEGAKSFLKQAVYVCDTDDAEWLDESRPVLVNHKSGDTLYLFGGGPGEIIEMDESPEGYFLRLRFPEGAETDVFDPGKLSELPAYEGERELSELNRSRAERVLSPYTVFRDGVLNVFWLPVPGAQKYRVALYSLRRRDNLPSAVKMADFDVDFEVCYFSLSGLVGDWFAAKVYAVGGDGEVLAESRGILNEGEPRIIGRRDIG